MPGLLKAEKWDSVRALLVAQRKELSQARGGKAKACRNAFVGQEQKKRNRETTGTPQSWLCSSGLSAAERAFGGAPAQ